MNTDNPMLYRPAALRADGWQTISLFELMEAENIPGASVAVIDDGKIAWAEAYGLQQSGQPGLVTPETRFQAASISKPVTALAALSLVQEGSLTLDEDIRRWQKGWRLPDNNGWQPRVTLRQILSHSDGITVHGFPGYAATTPLPTLKQVLNGEKPANTQRIMADTLPGLQFRYSGGGYTILQQLLEDVTRLPFEQVVRERVFEPAGMNHSSFSLVQHPSTIYAAGHRADGQPLAGGWHAYPESAAAGLWTTPSDLARLVVIIEQTLAGKEETLLSRALVDEMLRPQIRLMGIGMDGWEGLGLFLTREEGPAGEEWYFGHGGSNEGFRASLIARKGHGQATIIMTNADSGGELTDTWDASVALEYGWPGFPWSPPTPIQLEPAVLARLAGQYSLESGQPIQITAQAGCLTVEIADQPPVTALPRDALRFYLRQVNAEMKFNLEDESCTGFSLRQNGEEMKAERNQTPG